MREVIVIYPTRGQGYAYATSFPKELLESFRALFPLQGDRAWQDPVWCFKRKYLKAVQAWATQHAQEQHLALYDVTGMPKAKREQVLAQIWANEYEEHIAAMIGVLPKLPPDALCLAHWFPTHLVLDLRTFLERPFFDELKQAGLPAGKVTQTKLYIPMQGSHDVRLYAAADPRILRALIPLQIKNFQVQHLAVAQLFDNGTGHFTDQDGKLWFGASYQQLVGSSFDFHTPISALPYTITEVGETIYQVAQVDAYLEAYCTGIAPAFISAMSPDAPTEVFVMFFEHFGLLPVLSARISQLTEATEEAITPRVSSTHMELWREPSRWKHPADFFLHYLALSDRFPLLTLLGWDEERFQQIQADIRHMKMQKAEAYYRHCQEHAVELMQELLRTRFQRAEIQELASRYGIIVPLWSKEKMITQRCTDARMAEDLLGITEERQRRTEGPIPFVSGIIWGKRTPGDLYPVLYRGYLSDGQRAISSLWIDNSYSSWYVLWENWTAKKEKDRGHSVHILLEREGIEDLENWRWFVYRSEDMVSFSKVALLATWN